MHLATTAAELRSAIPPGRRVGFVPTMGALHAGHASLIDLARRECDFVVVSVFVNPTQFGPNEDLARYPRTFDADRDLCHRHGTDLIFAPSPEVVYPPGFRTFVDVDGLNGVLEGATRPGHFRGVATVVLKLLNLVGPCRAYFGQKDAQQVAVVRRMIRDLNVPVELRVGDTVREADGLALSSRNRYLSADDRRAAAVLYRALTAGAELVRAGTTDADRVRERMREMVKAVPAAELDYAEVADADTLEPRRTVSAPAVLLIAARFGATRLIDNLPLPPPD